MACGGGEVAPNFFLNMSFIWVEIRPNFSFLSCLEGMSLVGHNPIQDYNCIPKFSFLGCLEVVDLWLETKKQKANQNSIELMASLATARAEVVAGVMAKADQKQICTGLSQAQTQTQLTCWS